MLNTRHSLLSVAQGPLVVSAANPRYFTLETQSPADERTVYLTGAHVNTNFHDGAGLGADCTEIPESFDFEVKGVAVKSVPQNPQGDAAHPIDPHDTFQTRS